MDVSDIVLAVVLVFLLLVSFLNPGGLFLAAFLVVVLIGLRLFIPFAREYIVTVNSGKKGRVRAQQARRDADDQTGGRD